MNKSVHIEGLDLAGKSTICRHLEKLRNFSKRNNSLLPPNCNPLHAAADKLRKQDAVPSTDLGWMYYGSLLFDLKDYEKHATNLMLQDSTIIARSIAYHAVFGEKELSEKFRELLPEHPRFSFSCLLKASASVRLERLKGRISRNNDNPEDYLIQKDPEGFYKMEDILADIVINHFNGIIIDSSYLEQDGEKDRIANLILEKANV